LGILGGSWIVVIFFAIFVHRAMFHSSNILMKYRSISVDVNRKSEKRRNTETTPLLNINNQIAVENVNKV